MASGVEVSERLRVFAVIAATVRGGAEETFAALLRGLDRDRFEVYVACDGTGPMYEEFCRHAVRVWPMPLSSALYLSSIWKLARLIRQHRCHVVHTLLWNADVLGGVAARLTGVPALAAVQGAYFLPFGVSGLRKIRRLTMSRIFRLIYYGFDRITAPSQYVMTDLISRAGIPVPRGRLELVRNGIDIAHLDAQVRRCPPPQAGRRRPRIITPANFFPIKGHEWLIRAVPAVQARFAGVEFVLAGDGDSRPDMERLARDLGVAPSVTFAGSVENVIAEMLESDLFVLPSLSEGLSIALLEALALGMPVVATNTGGTPEVVADGQTGLLVAPRNPQALADAILALLDDPERARQLGANGRELVRQQFSVRAMIDRLEAAYVQLARAPVRPAPAQ